MFQSELDKNSLNLIKSSNLITEEEISRSERPLFINSKYHDIWKRAFHKIKNEIRLAKILNASKKHENSSKESFITRDLENIFNKNILNQNDFKPTHFKHKSIHPNSTPRTLWDLYICVLLMYTCFITPVNLAYFDPSPSDPLFLIDVLIDFSFFIDLILNFFTGYYDKEGNLRMGNCEIAKNYVFSWFFLDIISAFPSGIIEVIMDQQDEETKKNSNYNQLLKIIQVRNIARLFRITRAAKLIKYSQKDSVLSGIQNCLKISHSTRRLLTTLFVTFLCIHIFSCFFYYACVYNDFSPDCWVTRYGIGDKPKIDIYISSTYYTIVTLTTIGYGDIVPRTKIEKCLAMMWMVVAVYFLSFVISSLSNSLAQSDVKRALLDQKLALLDNFSEEVGIDKITKKQIQEEIRLKVLRSTYSSSLKQEVIQDLSADLKLRIAKKMYGGIFEAFDFFKKADQVFVTTIFPLLEAHHVIENEIIYSENDFPEYIYFIGRGRVHFCVSGLSKPFSFLSVGGYFGEIEMARNTKRFSTAVSSTDTFLLGLGTSLIAKVKEGFSKIWSQVEVNSEKKLKNYIKDLAQMKVCLRVNSSDKGLRDFKKMKEAVIEEIKTLTAEINGKSDSNDIKELARVIKEEMSSNREILKAIEKKVKNLQKKEKHLFIKNKSQLPPLKLVKK